MVDRIYLTELQLHRANSSDTGAPFLDLNLCLSNSKVSTKIYDKRDDFDFDIINFPFLDGDVPRRTSYGVYISQLIRFARASSNLSDFNCRNKSLTAKLTLCCCFTRRFVLCLTVCYYVLVFFSPFSIVITSLGEERAS